MKAFSLYQQYSRSAFAVLACICAASVFLYGAFLLLAVGHTASRARAGHSTVELKAKLSAVEGRYLAATRALTPEYAARLGYVRPASIATVYASKSSPVLTLESSGARQSASVR